MDATAVPTVTYIASDVIHHMTDQGNVIHHMTDQGRQSCVRGEYR
ncbi:hypothetical protein SAMN06264855_10231 [Halorubrum vacuolatum]|uniref:Uncharacterized protein n=1 Tax=Halorubrum vacuolatum TaxID=63740 RepID=A0A238V7D1_HALVU|nr:hypothetical protein SAMN06264855_10231 [Halorubrum vacuolatum]